MCWVFWLHNINNDEWILKDFIAVVEQSKIRWLHSFWAFDWDTLERYFNINDLISSIKSKRSQTILWHNRYSTSGDRKELENNQPLIKKGLVLAFNGVIDQSDKSNRVKDSLWYETNNDWEIIMNAILNNWIDKISDYFPKKCSFAWLIFVEWKMYAYRNKNRPLRLKMYDDGSVIVASTSDIMTRAWIKDHIQILPDKLISING